MTDALRFDEIDFHDGLLSSAAWRADEGAYELVLSRVRESVVKEGRPDADRPGAMRITARGVGIVSQTLDAAALRDNARAGQVASVTLDAEGRTLTAALVPGCIIVTAEAFSAQWRPEGGTWEDVAL
ncbi:hypothetical protein ACQ5SO_09430 [Rhodovulum sp. DZ06]|uniref:hypothetical protein n=1 Tax=Rhodovulum sp. DZ06 TaxID=3425126 RepID=UPI003D33DF67